MGVRVKDEGQFKEIYVKALDTLPVGTSVEYAGTTIPDELKGTWLFERGQELSRTEYAKLFSVIGTSYGVGDGSTTFNLPNKCGRVPVGLDENDTDFDTIGKTLGEKKHTMTINELVNHKHTIIWNTSGAHATNTLVDGGADAYIKGQESGATGGGQPFNIIQPSIVKNFIIKVKETRPLASHTVNAYSESESNAYSCDYVNNALTYSTDEVNTHKKWIDGKDIYRKVISTVTSGTYSEGGNTYTWIAKSLYDTNNEISFVTDMKVNFVGSRQYFGGSSELSYTLLNDGRIQIGIANAYASTTAPIYITIEYTKTQQSTRSSNTYSGDIEEKKDIVIDDGGEETPIDDENKK